MDWLSSPLLDPVFPLSTRTFSQYATAFVVNSSQIAQSSTSLFSLSGFSSLGIMVSGTIDTGGKLFNAMRPSAQVWHAQLLLRLINEPLTS